MSVGVVLAVVAVVFLILMVVETPVFIALGASGSLGIMLLASTDVATSALGSLPYNATSQYTLSIIPLYVLLGMFALRAMLAQRLYGIAARLLRWLPGGLGVATIAACAGFAAISGSSLATAATIGKLSIMEMRRYGYPSTLAAGIVAAAGTLGVLIPPSILVVIYAVMAQVSIGQMLLAGVVPGLILAFAFGVYVATRSRTMVQTAPGEATGGSDTELERTLVRASSGGARKLDGASKGAGATSNGTGNTEHPTGDSKPEDHSQHTGRVTITKQIRAIFWIAAIAASILAGLFTGVFTVIESSAIGAAVALIMVFVELAGRPIKSLGREIVNAAREAVGIVGMTFAIIVGATILTQFLVMARVPNTLTAWAGDLAVPPEIVVLAILIILIPLGMFLDSISIILVVVPLAAPIVAELGLNPIWFGVLFIIMLEIGLITPPVGMNVFVTATTSGVAIEKVFKGVLPFLLVMLGVVSILFAFPGIVTWLPGLIS